jgi:hypothetical protein
MRHKTIRGAVVATTLVTFTLAAAPASARPARPGAHRVAAAATVSRSLGDWVLSWAGVIFPVLDREAGAGDRTKASPSTTPVLSSRPADGGMELDFGAGIDPLGQH